VVVAVVSPTTYLFFLAVTKYQITTDQDSILIRLPRELVDAEELIGRTSRLSGTGSDTPPQPFNPKRGAPPRLRR